MPRIINNIEAFAKKIFETLSQSSPDGRFLLHTVFLNARERYLSKTVLHKRLSRMDEILHEMEGAADLDLLLAMFRNFVSSGAWNTNSANSVLFFELIKASGYEYKIGENEAKILKKEIPALKKQVCKLIVAHLKHQDYLKIEAEKQQKELLKLSEISMKDLPHIILCSSHEEAVEARLNHPEKQVFLLQHTKESGWKLSWYDLLSRPVFLPVRNQMHLELAKLEKNSLPDQISLEFKKLKACCGKSIPLFNYIYLFDTVTKASEFSAAHPEKLSICLQRQPAANGTWQAAWFDCNGKSRQLALSSGLLDILSKHETFIPTNTRNYFLMLEHFSFIAKELLNKIQVMIDPEPYELKDVTSTFILHTDTGKLIWCDTLGEKQPVCIQNFSALSQWLNQNQVNSEEKIQHFKTLLKHLNMRREVDEVKQVRVLNFLQKKHGLSLIFNNDFTKIPPFRLIPGTYVLVREPAVKEGVWTLYHRQKGGMNVKINTDDWESFHQILSEFDDKMPEELPEKNRQEIANSVQYWVQSNKKVMQFAAQPKKEIFQPKKLSMENYSKILNLFAPKKQEEMPNKLNLADYAQVATLFGHHLTP